MLKFSYMLKLGKFTFVIRLFVVWNHFVVVVKHGLFCVVYLQNLLPMLNRLNKVN